MFCDWNSVWRRTLSCHLFIVLDLCVFLGSLSYHKIRFPMRHVLACSPVYLGVGDLSILMVSKVSLNQKHIESYRNLMKHNHQVFELHSVTQVIFHRLHNTMLLRGPDSRQKTAMQSMSVPSLWFLSEPAAGIETCRWGKERRGGCENFLKLFAVSPFRTRWSSLVEKEKLLFCISYDKKWLCLPELARYSEE